MHHEGEPAVARVAQRAGIPYALSTMGTTSVEDLAAAAPDGRRWFQLYLWRDREASRRLRRPGACVRLRGAGADRRLRGRRGAAARCPQRLHDPAGAEVAHGCRRGGAPGLVAQPADHRAAAVRLAELVGRHDRRAGRPGVRPSGHPAGRPVAARCVARKPCGQRDSDGGRRAPRRRRRRGRRRRVQPRRAPTRPRRHPARTAAGRRRGGRRPGRGVHGRRRS